MCELSHYPSTHSPPPEALRVVTYDITPSLQGSLDQGIPLPPLPRYPEWYLPHAPESLPELLEWDSDRFLGDVNSDDKSPSQPFFKSPEVRCWIEWKEQEAVALRTAGVRAQDPSQCLRMQAKSLLHCQVLESGDIHLVMAIWKSVLGQEQVMWDHDVLGCRDCVCHPVTMKWSYCSSSCYHPEHPHHLCLSENCCGLEDWSN